ncbi:lipopolysaccharide biosynthesis protein [Bradyrhizobium sp. 182]|uniref:lipopolysaccharide biosynthesis protein n=1 Tax=unclassified Bradyrhizobium TaxID=2631580 RepID=UPI001FF9B483|nr:MULTISPECIES: lipopolysaccharide biosynthesis protein [unclassified Bradyrhizobium]MCK1424838.1 lipopolysaccharide biosynthesis protein [Bradyrhizobium sp. CW12]MCK1531868.1 lipopolysaccharide biosynthesis protein [Bradyrhizobium sp. 182]MCK1646519.1 lipopolysaccharide biosynthesis protein [Bradyrhizobium sp. 154]
MDDVKEKAIRGGFAKVCGQAVSFALRIISVAILARLLDPGDFGLVAMATVVTGVYGLFTTAGLSSATVQQATITDEQISTLFWINMGVGILLAAICAASAPALVAFYNEPRLFWITVAIGAGFVLNAGGVQHSALLERRLRYVTMTAVELLSQVGGMVAAICMALAGFGYWALIASAMVSPTISTACMWMATAWMPGAPRWGRATLPMLRFGGTITVNGFVVYVAYNLEKVLLGRFWGADALGIYGRAYQLVTIPTDNLNGAVGGVAFSALSRLQHDSVRLRNYFLKGYSLVVSLTIPATIFCALFSEDIVLVVLGPKWLEAAVIFRLLAPTVLVFGMINPLSWLLLSVGLQGRSLAIALVIAPLVVSSYFVGLPYGPKGVAIAYSAAMTLWVLPHLAWCLHGTAISLSALLLAISRPFLSGIVAAMVAYIVQVKLEGWGAPLMRLLVEGSVMLSIYCLLLLLVMGQRAFYLDLLAALRKSSLRDGTASLG